MSADTHPGRRESDLIRFKRLAAYIGGHGDPDRGHSMRINTTGQVPSYAEAFVVFTPPQVSNVHPGGEEQLQLQYKTIRPHKMFPTWVEQSWRYTVTNTSDGHIVPASSLKEGFTTTDKDPNDPSNYVHDPTVVFDIAQHSRPIATNTFLTQMENLTFSEAVRDQLNVSNPGRVDRITVKYPLIPTSF